jgi:hypothetical protein
MTAPIGPSCYAEWPYRPAKRRLPGTVPLAASGIALIHIAPW